MKKIIKKMICFVTKKHFCHIDYDENIFCIRCGKIIKYRDWELK